MLHTSVPPMRKQHHVLFVVSRSACEHILQETAASGRISLSPGAGKESLSVEADSPQPLSRLSRELAKAGVAHVFVPDGDLDDYLRYKEAVMVASKMPVDQREDARHGWANDDLIWYALCRNFAPDDAAAAIRAGWLRRTGAPGLQIFQFVGSTLHGIAGPDQASASIPLPVTG